MNAASAQSQFAIPSEEMARLHNAGFSLLPLGKGADGKSPLLGFSGAQRIPLARVLAPMHRTGSLCYGIRLDRVAVIDCDVNDPSLIDRMQHRFGISPVHVKTPRGCHLYYRSDGGSFPNLRGEGLPVDIKRGVSSYVIGPHSVRPDGGAYFPARGSLGIDALPLIRTTSTPTTRKIQEGDRHYALVTASIGMVEAVDDADELFGNLQSLRDDLCADPASVPDGEIRKITDWAWSKRLEGKVYHGRDSDFRLHRNALDALRGLPNASDAIALFVTLQDQHGHRSKPFPLSYPSMRAAGYTDLSRDRFVSARDALRQVGLLDVATRHIAGKQPRAYRLNRLRQHADNVTLLHAALSAGEGV